MRVSPDAGPNRSPPSGQRYYRRLTLITQDSVVADVIYPVEAPAAAAREALERLARRGDSAASEA